MDDQKRCGRCGETKSLDDFSVDRSRPSGRQPACKACNKARYEANRSQVRASQNAYRAANPVVIAARHAARYAERRAQVAAMKLTLRCVDCGWKPATIAETEKLDFDHTDPATKWKPNRGSYNRMWSWSRILKELALCEPRCKPCHWKRTARLRHNQPRQDRQDVLALTDGG